MQSWCPCTHWSPRRSSHVQSSHVRLRKSTFRAFQAVHMNSRYFWSLPAFIWTKVIKLNMNMFAKKTKIRVFFSFFFVCPLLLFFLFLNFPSFSLTLFPSLHRYSQSVLELRKWTVCLFLEAGKEGKPKVSYGERGSKERGGGMCGGDKSPFSLCLCSETADASEQLYWIQAQEQKQGKTDWFRFQLERKERIKGTPTAAVCYQVSVTCTSCKGNMFCFSLELWAWSHF